VNDIPKLMAWQDIWSIIAQQYDIVLNGCEIGGWSIRAHIPAMLRATYRIMGQTDEQIDQSIGHMLQAFAHGTPPHGWLALGLDRIVMLLHSHPSIRDTMAFPKNGSWQDLFFQSPSILSDSKIRQANVMRV
jgi:aspartyl-tRNA synthetase